MPARGGARCLTLLAVPHPWRAAGGPGDAHFTLFPGRAGSGVEVGQGGSSAILRVVRCFAGCWGAMRDPRDLSLLWSPCSGTRCLMAGGTES